MQSLGLTSLVKVRGEEIQNETSREVTTFILAARWQQARQESTCQMTAKQFQLPHIACQVV